jgi:DNA-binding transcriptional ArsR family regulator
MVNLKPAQMDRVFHALSDTTRRRMLERLGGEPARIGDLAAPFSISLPAVSKHVDVLENAGLVRRRKSGREIFVELKPEPLDKAIDWLERQRRFWDASFDQLEKLLQNQPQPTRKETKP